MELLGGRWSFRFGSLKELKNLYFLCKSAQSIGFIPFFFWGDESGEWWALNIIYPSNFRTRYGILWPLNFEKWKNGEMLENLLTKQMKWNDFLMICHFLNYLLFCFIINTHKYRVITNYFVISLALADIMVALMAMTFNMCNQLLEK